MAKSVGSKYPYCRALGSFASARYGFYGDNIVNSTFSNRDLSDTWTQHSFSSVIQYNFQPRIQQASCTRLGLRHLESPSGIRQDVARCLQYWGVLKMLRLSTMRGNGFSRLSRTHSKLTINAAQQKQKALPTLDEELEGQIWNRLDEHIGARKLRVFPAYILGFCDTSAVWLKNILKEMGITSYSSSVNGGEFFDFGPVTARYFYVLINAQAFEDSLELVKRLISFRERRVEAIVVLISDEVYGDDLGAERSAISDATLRAPIDQNRLRSGLSSAFENRRALKIKQLKMG